MYLGILDALQLDKKDPNDLLTLGVADAEPAHAPPPFGAMRSGRPGSRRSCRRETPVEADGMQCIGSKWKIWWRVYACKSWNATFFNPTDGREVCVSFEKIYVMRWESASSVQELLVLRVH